MTEQRTPEQLMEELAEVVRDKPEAVEQFLLCQMGLTNPATIVRFRAGFLFCREYMARFVEGESPSIAASIRANWIPRWGDDPGLPRRFDVDEIAEGGEEGPWKSKPVEPSREAGCEAAMIMFDLGMAPDGEAPRSFGERDDDASGGSIQRSAD